MYHIYLLNYSVQGIKTIDRLLSLSFYKKTITKDLDIQNYNVKGIYGMNGSGKSGIVTSVDIFRNLIVDKEYLSNPMTQKKLEALINKKTKELFIEAEYLLVLENILILYRYNVLLSKDGSGKYVIAHEELYVKRATSRKSDMKIVYRAHNGEIEELFCEDNKLYKMIVSKTTNLLSTSSMCSLFFGEILSSMGRENVVARDVLLNMLPLFMLGKKTQAYLDEEDDHKEYLTRKYEAELFGSEMGASSNNEILDSFFKAKYEQLDIIYVTDNYVLKEAYDQFELTVKKLYEFLRIFKPDLNGIEIDRKEDRHVYICDLVLVYDSYKINAEFESTGIKKLIKLFAYLKQMVGGGIVFIDEFDSNLHDVYLCALLEYLMEYAKGQFCFTTHNVGPMDILKHNKKSIDFLSEDHKLYQWKTNGNYSPSKLYRNGMIEGSPFNVDATDFIGVFGE